MLGALLENCIIRTVASSVTRLGETFLWHVNNAAEKKCLMSWKATIDFYWNVHYRDICFLLTCTFKADTLSVYSREILIFDAGHAKVTLAMLYRGNPTITSVPKNEKNARRFERDLLCDVRYRGAAFFSGVDSNENKISLTFLSSRRRAVSFAIRDAGEIRPCFLQKRAKLVVA